MKPNALALALLSTATVLPGTVHAADDICSRLFIYAVSQICQMLPNGQNLCQPIGLARPDPSCDRPNANQVVQIPLGPPSIQAWPNVQFPALPNVFPPNAFAPNAFAPNAFAPNAFAPNAFVPNQFAGNPYLTYLAGQSPNAVLPVPVTPSPATPAAPVAAKAPVSEPPKTPDAPPAQTPAVVAEVKPETIVAAAPVAAVTQPIDKLMPEVKPEPVPAAQPEAKPESAATVVAEQAAPVASTAVAAQPAAEPLPPVVEAKPAEQPVTQVTATAAPATVPASPVAAEAAKPVAIAEAEKEAEKARQDALAHFEFDSAELTPVGRAMLDDWLKQASTNDPILVTGHADRLGPEPYNEKLSQMRAESVRKYLIEKGKPANRIVIQAKGEKFPLISCSGAPTDATIACLAPNRRAEVVYKPGVRKSARTATKLVKPKSRR